MKIKFNLKSRKFIAWVVGMICLIVVTVLIIFKAPDQIAVFGAYFLAGLVFLTALFIGGTVWSDFVKSKYFRSELSDKDEAGK